MKLLKFDTLHQRFGPDYLVGTLLTWVHQGIAAGYLLDISVHSDGIELDEGGVVVHMKRKLEFKGRPGHRFPEGTTMDQVIAGQVHCIDCRAFYGNMLLTCPSVSHPNDYPHSWEHMPFESKS